MSARRSASGRTLGVALAGLPARHLTAAAGSALLAAAASRPWGLGLLALVAYVPVFDAISRSRSPAAGGVLAGVAALGVTSVAYEATAAIGAHVYLMTLLLAPLPYAAAGAVAARLGRRSVLAAVLALPVLWCTAEWLPAQPRLWGTLALPLGAIGYSQADLPTLQVARLSSVTAVSAVVLSVNALVLVAWRTRVPTQRVAALSGIAALGLLVATLSHDPATAGTPESVVLRLVQPNLPDSAYAAAATLPTARRALALQLVTLAASPPAGRDDPAPGLTVLPEAAWPGPLEVDPGPAGRVDPLLFEAGLPEPSLFGAASTGRGAPGPSGAGPGQPQGPAWFANSAFLLSDGVVTLVQDKLNLVPFAEDGLRAGTGPDVFMVGDLPVAVLICYDAAFPATSRAAAAAGAAVLAILTDDSFAAHGDVPRLHVRLAVFRAVETGLPVALASNTGPSALVAADGSVVARSPELIATSLTAALPLTRRVTPYAELGDWLGVLALLGTLVIGAAAVSKGGGVGSIGSRPT